MASYGSIDGSPAEVLDHTSTGNSTNERVVSQPKANFSRVMTIIFSAIAVATVFMLALVYVPTPLSSSSASSAASSSGRSSAKTSSSSSSSEPAIPGSSGATIFREQYSTKSDEEKAQLFQDFAVMYSKSYAADTQSSEYTARYANFVDNLAVIDARNTAEALANGEAIHGITPFSDLTQKEFESMYLMTEYEGKTILEAQGIWRRQLINDSKKPGQSRKSLRYSTDSKNRKLDEATASYKDWTDLITTPVNDQGSGCAGSSWAWAAVQQVESDSIRKGYLTTSDALSAQELLSCCVNATGCISGSVEAAYAYIQKGSSEAGAIHLASQYPYTATNNEAGECTAEASDYAITIGSSATVTKYHNELEGYTTTQVESNALAHLVSTGTLHACLDASTWNTYVSGTMFSCVGEKINHCVQIVGVNYDPITDQGWYKIRNSWGSQWGAAGFIYLAHGINACDVTYNPGYTDPTNNLGR